MTNTNSGIVFLGAGAIGCYVGAVWADAGLAVTLLGRESVLRLGETGLRVSNGITLTPQVSCDPAVLSNASLIVLSVKSTALHTAIADIAQHAAPDTPILCLLNGLKPMRDLRTAFPNRDIAAGMVPYNVVWADAATLSRSSIGDIVVERRPFTETLSAQLSHAREPIQLSDTIAAVQNGKLLLNLNNPVNALSGQTLFTQLRDRAYRRAYAAILSEAIGVIEAANLPHAQSGPLPAAKIVKMLRMPNWFFNTLVLPRQKLDPSAQTSMAQDLNAGKPTEIDTINAEICHIAATTGQSAPINAKIVELVKAAETGGQTTFTGKDLCKALGV